MSEPRINIHLNMSGTITLANFMKVAALIEAETYDVAVSEYSSVGKSSLSAAVPTPAAEHSADVAEASPLATDSDPNDIDAHGHPWSAELHASTKTKTKDGLWRMKVGVTRPEPLAGFPATETLSSTSTASQAGETAVGVTEPAGSSPTEEPASADASPAADEEDEFAAFRAAAAKVDAAATPVVVPEREWTDSDLGALCNQAAVKLGDPSPVKEQIAKFVPEGEVAHSRNVPADKRAEFVKAIEAAAGIEFAG